MKVKIFAYISALAFGLAGCKKGFHDINDNPNSITASNIRTNLVLPAALHSAGATDAAGNGIGYNWLNRWMGYWSSSGSFAPTQEESTYNLTGNFMETKWVRMYNYLNDFYFIEQKAISEGKEFYTGISKVMKAKYFQDLVDLFGNVPYSQAFQLSQFPTPKYDKGELIYADLQKQLDAAIDIFKNKPVPGEAGGSTPVDIMFHGNKTLWIKFANTLKLRLLIRQTGIPGFNPTDELQKIKINGDVLLSGESASVNPGYTNSTGKQNPFYSTFGYTVTGNNANEAERANAYFIGLLKAHNDPRLQRYFRPASTPLNPADPFVGTVYGMPPNDALNSNRTSGFGPGLVGSASQAQWILTSVESMFLYAEAIARGWLNGDAKTAYENAVLESFKWLGVSNPASAAEAYMNNNAVANWVNSGNSVQEKVLFIVNQKYLALAGISPLEAWCDYRRLGIPATLPLSADAGRVGNGLPVRLLYPTIEYAVNKANVEAEGSINQFSSRVFWDK